MDSDVLRAAFTATIAFFIAGTTFFAVVTDMYTTVVGIESGCTREINPLKRDYTPDDFIFDGYRNAFILSFLTALFVGALLGSVKPPVPYLLLLAILLSVMYAEAFVVYHNVQQLAPCLNRSD